MNNEVFQLTDDSKIDDSINKIDFRKIYHQHRAKVNVRNQNNKHYFGESHNYIKVGNRFLELEIQI